MFMRNFLIITLCVFSFEIFAQNDIRVESFEIDGELTLDDPISDGLGRINAVQLNLNEGDKLFSSLTADFVPMLVLVAPSGEYHVNYPDEETLIASFETTINENGVWLLYIVGDSTDSGEYTLTNKYASASSLDFDKSGDYCKNISLLINHAKADFHFITGSIIDEDEVVYSSKISFPGAKNSSIEGLGNKIFKVLLFSGEDKKEAEISYNESVASISACLENDWHKKSNPWKQVVGGDNQKIKSTYFSDINGSERFLNVVLNENNPNTKLKFDIEVIISKD